MTQYDYENYKIPKLKIKMILHQPHKLLMYEHKDEYIVLK